MNYPEISCIYCLTSPSGKNYIGQTKNLKKRMSYYRRNHHKKQRALFNATTKYGLKNFKIQILEELGTVDELNEAETFYIIYLNTICPHGYNLNYGGNSKECSEETRNKISKISKTMWENMSEDKKLERSKKSSNRQRGKKLSIEQRKKMSEISRNMPQSQRDRIAKSVSIYYWKLSEEEKVAINKKRTLKLKGRKLSKERINKVLDKVKENNPNWGIYKHSKYDRYEVKFERGSAKNYKYGFKTIEEARVWRDAKLKELSSLFKL